MTLAEAYFDESNTHVTNQRLCVAGYIFEKDNALTQGKLWHSMLDCWRLPHFHMVDCAHNSGVFSHLPRQECDLAAREAIKIIKETASTGVGISILESDFKEIIPNLKFYGSAYDACARYVIGGVAHWVEQSKFDGYMHYFFESGVATEKNAGHCILDMMRDDDIRNESHYSGHTFGKKSDHLGLQAADILAWHVGTDCRRAINGEPIRKDFQSLLEIPHEVLHISREMLEKIAQGILESMEGISIDQANEIENMIRGTRKRR